MIIQDGEITYELDLTDWFGYNFPEEEKETIPWFKDQLWDYVKHSHKGMRYRIMRMSWGIWNGYVYIPSDHPLHGKGFMEDDGEIDELSVHGGITYNCLSDENDPLSDWTIGFDTNHMYDHAPSDKIRSEGEYNLAIKYYKTHAYVMKEAKNLIKDIKKKYS
tara:strand:- start:183 stop:668 length:486 start_codon:yes stop_codon:yes gene_type:complete